MSVSSGATTSMSVYGPSDTVNLTNGAWLDALSEWEKSAVRKAKARILARSLQTLPPRVPLTPTSGTWSQDDLVFELPTFPAAWVRGLEADKANDPAVLQILALATYANLLTHRPIIDEGARGAGDGTTLLFVVAAIAALRAGITASTGILPNRVSEPCSRLIKLQSGSIYVAGTHKHMVEHAWIGTFMKLIAEYQPMLAPEVLKKVSDLAPIAMSAGSALRSRGPLAAVGRAHASRLASELAGIFRNSRLSQMTWAMEVIPLEATAPFPVSICLETISDPAMAEATSRCFPCSNDVFARSVRREKELRAQAKMLGFSPLDMLRLESATGAPSGSGVEEVEDEVSFDSDPESPPDSPAGTPRAASPVQEIAAPATEALGSF